MNQNGELSFSRPLIGPGGGGGGTYQKFWWGCAAGPPETWPCSKLDLVWFWYPVLNWIPKTPLCLELRVFDTCPYVSQENLLQPELSVYKFYVVVYPVPNIIFLIYLPCSKLEGLKTIPWPAAHTRIVNVWEFPHPPLGDWFSI